MPVQGAKVTYTIKRNPAFWWWWSRDDDESPNEIARENTMTDDDGAFRVNIPLTLPKGKKRPGFYNFEVTATVVDQGGETRLGSMSLPLGSKLTALSCDLPERSEKDSLKSITFSFRNASGAEIHPNGEGQHTHCIRCCGLGIGQTSAGGCLRERYG